MMKNKIQEVSPWTNDELKKILEEVVSHGSEMAKIDFKTEIKIDTQEKKAELLKDIIAIANTYDDDNYHDYGFLLYGVKSKSIIGISETQTDTDKFQNEIEQLLNQYVAPRLQVYVFGFETDGKTWGAIVIPPRNNKPHMFFKELQCKEVGHLKKKGAWFVRRGSTTDVGLPEDLAVITQRQTEALLEPLKESIRVLQTRVLKTEEQYNSALFKLVEQAVSSLSGKDSSKNSVSEDVIADIDTVLGTDLPSKLKKKLRTPKDVLAEDFIKEVKMLLNYLEGADTGLSWTPQLDDSEVNKKTIEELEKKTHSLMVSVATILLHDTDGKYTEVLMRGLKMLAKEIEAPSGIQYNRIGTALRYYPIGLIMYTVFISGVATNKGAVLKQILEIQIKHRNRDYKTPITDIFFYWYEAREFFNNANQQKLCEPIVQRIRQVIGDQIGDMIGEFSESEYFFRGEFVLVLANISKCMANGEVAEHRTPLPGLYLYMHEGNEPIRDFLEEKHQWFETLYGHSINEVLDMFDRNASKMSGPGCFAIGMHGLKTREIYDKSSAKK